MEWTGGIQIRQFHKVEEMAGNKTALSEITAAEDITSQLLVAKNLHLPALLQRKTLSIQQTGLRQNVTQNLIEFSKRNLRKKISEQSRCPSTIQLCKQEALTALIQQSGVVTEEGRAG